MSFGTNERIVTTFEKKQGSDLTRLVLTNYRVSYESSGSWFKKIKGIQSVTLKSVHSANLVVRHNPIYLIFCLLGVILIAIAFSDYKHFIPNMLEMQGEQVGLFAGIILFLLGLWSYFRSRSSGITIKAQGETISMDAHNVKGDAYDFVSKVMEEIANSKN